jgi:hypothetical protein
LRQKETNMPLTDMALRAAKPRDNGINKRSDGGGLQFWVTPECAKLWRLAYRFAGKQKLHLIRSNGSLPSCAPISAMISIAIL